VNGSADKEAMQERERATSGPEEGSQSMAEALTDVLFAAYQDVATATRDFDRLLKIVEDKQDDAGG
jgi:hypothetical protein